jgi:hypothetical protein
MAPPSMKREEVKRTAEAYEQHGRNQSATAQALGMSRGGLQDRLRRAAQYGFLQPPRLPLDAAPPIGFVIKARNASYDADGSLRRQTITTAREPGEGFDAIPGHMIKGESVLVDADNRVVQKWIKTREGAVGSGLVEALRDAFAGLSGLPQITAAQPAPGDVLTLYPLADLHMGMMSWGRETGQPYDLSSASMMIRNRFDALTSRSPAGPALLVFLGDLLHQNDQTNATPQSRHQLDVDGRYPKVLRAAADLAAHAIARALAAHTEVSVMVIKGNHDPESSAAVHLALSMRFADHDRVTVDDIPRDLAYFRFGTNLLGFAHGDKITADRAAHAMAADRPEDWGATTCRRFFTGHYHREASMMAGAVKCEHVGSPVARDNFANSGGWRTERVLRAYHFDRLQGETSSTVEFVKPEMAA